MTISRETQNQLAKQDWDALESAWLQRLEAEPGDLDYFEYFKQVEKGLTVYFGNRERWFSAVYVDDLIDAMLNAAGNESAAAG